VHTLIGNPSYKVPTLVRWLPITMDRVEFQDNVSRQYVLRLSSVTGLFGGRSLPWLTGRRGLRKNGPLTAKTCVWLLLLPKVVVPNALHEGDERRWKECNQIERWIVRVVGQELTWVQRIRFYPSFPHFRIMHGLVSGARNYISAYSAFYRSLRGHRNTSNEHLRYPVHPYAERSKCICSVHDIVIRGNRMKGLEAERWAPLRSFHRGRMKEYVVFTLLDTAIGWPIPKPV
jgi:hypothetical protein